MAKLAAKKKPTKPDAPKKPTSRSKTGNAECSQAASNWQLSIRGKATLNPGTYQTLAKCRALSKSGQMADAQGRTGKLSDQGAAALKGRLQSRFDNGLITQKSRQDRLEMLLKQRSQQRKPTPPPTAPPQPERYSLQGKLAPGRGTEERKDAARNNRYERLHAYSDRDKRDIAYTRGVEAARKAALLDKARTSRIEAKMRQEFESKDARRRELYVKREGLLQRRRRQVAEKVLQDNKIPVKPPKTLSAKRKWIEKADTAINSSAEYKALAERDRRFAARYEKAQRANDYKRMPDRLEAGWLGKRTDKILAEMKSKANSVLSRVVAKPATTAPTPPKYSLGGQLAPGRGKDAPEYRDRLLKTLTKTQDRARNYELGRVDNPRVPIRTYIERGKELRLGTVANLRNAYNAETSKYVDQLHAQGRSASESVAVPKNTAQKITAEAQKRAKKETAERNENLESLKAGAIPLRWKVDGPKGFENIIIPSAEKNSMVVSAKPVGKGGRVAVQYLEEKGSYSALDVQGGYKLGGKMSMKGATRYGRAADYLLARAERKTGKKLAFSDLGKNKELKPYFQTLRNIQSLPRLTY